MALPLPPLYHQLDGSPTQGEDCGPCACATAVAFASRNRVTPDQHAVRRQMANPTGPTSIRDSERAFLSYDDEFRRRGLSDPFRRMLVFGTWKDDGVPALKADRGIELAVSYAAVNAWQREHRYQKVSGDRRFMGDHMIFIAGWRVSSGGRVSIRVWDSTHDGRRQEIPEGPMFWPLELLKEASAAVRARYADGVERPVGYGRLLGMVIRRSELEANR